VARQRQGRPAWVRRICSNRVMEEIDKNEQRLIDLEVKIGFAEDLLEQLNQTLFRQQQMLDTLTREVAQLRRLIPDADEGAARSPDDLPPPHY
jgi:SlyX protein